MSASPQVPLDRKEEIGSLISALRFASGETKILFKFIDEAAELISQGKSPAGPPRPGGGDEKIMELMAELHLKQSFAQRAFATIDEKAALVIQPRASGELG